MKKSASLIIPVILLFLESCVASLHPVTENKNDLVFKKELLGNWVDKDLARYIIEEASEQGNKFYRATVIDPKRSSEPVNFSDTSYFIVSLASIKGKLFLDCIADIKKFENKNVGGAAVSSLVPAHFIIQVISVSPHEVVLSPIDHDELLKVLNQGKLKIKTEILNKDDILFTEKPKNLQQKLMELEKFPGVFSRSILKRAIN